MSDDESAGAAAGARSNPEQGPGSDAVGDSTGSSRPSSGDPGGGYAGSRGGYAGGGPGGGYSSSGYSGGGYSGSGYSVAGESGGGGSALRQLRRERRSRMIAGVCGGLGRHLNIDPVVFRILFVVLTFFGGFGLLVYALAWLFVPEDGDQESEARKLVNGRSAVAAVAISLLVVIGLLVLTATPDHSFGHTLPLLLLASAIVVVMVWRGEGRGEPPSRTGYTEGGWGPTSDNPERPQPWWQRPVPTSPAPGSPGSAGPANSPSESARAGQSSPTGPGAGTSAAAGYESPEYGRPEFSAPTFGSAQFGADTGTGPIPMPPPYVPSGSPAAASGTASSTYEEWGSSGPAGYGPPSGPGAQPAEAYEPPSRPRRVSGLTLSGALLILGVLGVLAETGAIHVGWTAGLALTVMAVGAGLAIGGLFGRARGLIPLGLVLAVPLIVASAVGVPLRGETGNTVWRPVSADQITAPYDLVAGRGELDLTALNPEGGTLHATAYVGAGRLLVTVPDDVAITVTAHVGMGQIQFIDQSTHAGIDVTENFTSPAIGHSRGTIALDLKTGAGEVEVDRVGG